MVIYDDRITDGQSSVLNFLQRFFAPIMCMAPRLRENSHSQNVVLLNHFRSKSVQLSLKWRRLLHSSYCPRHRPVICNSCKSTQHRKGTETGIEGLITFLLIYLKKERHSISVLKTDITNYVVMFFWPCINSTDLFHLPTLIHNSFIH